MTASGRLAREVAVYLFVLCKAILMGLQNQLRADGLVKDGVYGIQPKFDEDIQDVYRDFVTGTVLSVDEHPHMEKAFAVGTAKAKVYVDAVTGQPLVKELVMAARAKELSYFDEKGVWRKRPREEAFQRTGKGPITVRWIDVNKGDDDEPNYRSRLVAREIRKNGEDPIFAPTPPLESLRRSSHWRLLTLARTSLVSETRRVSGGHRCPSSTSAARTSAPPQILRIRATWSSQRKTKTTA